MSVNVVGLIAGRHVVAPDALHLILCRRANVLQLRVYGLLLLGCIDDSTLALKSLRQCLRWFFINFGYFLFWNAVGVQVDQHVLGDRAELVPVTGFEGLLLGEDLVKHRTSFGLCKGVSLGFNTL